MNRRFAAAPVTAKGQRAAMLDAAGILKLCAFVLQAFFKCFFFNTNNFRKEIVNWFQLTQNVWYIGQNKNMSEKKNYSSNLSQKKYLGLISIDEILQIVYMPNRIWCQIEEK